MPVRERDAVEVTRHMRRYLERLFQRHPLRRVTDRFAEKVADRVAVRLAEDYETHMETLEVLADEELMEDLRRASTEPDEDARPYEEIRRELGLA